MPRDEHNPHYERVYIFDFTFFQPDSETLPAVEEFVKELQPLAKKWVFQTEKTPTTDRLHYQGRMSLHKKMRQPELCRALNEGPLRGMDVSESSNNSKAFEVFYCIKHETRVAGPWDNRSWTPPPYVPRQYAGLLDRLYPWQQAVLDSRNTFNGRKIDVVVDTRGCSGKATVGAPARVTHGGI